MADSPGWAGVFVRRCQRSWGCRVGRPGDVEAGGHQKSRLTPTGHPGGRSREFLCWLVQWDHSLAGEGLGQAVGFAVGLHEVGVVHEPVDRGGGEGLGHDRVKAFDG